MVAPGALGLLTVAVSLIGNHQRRQQAVRLAEPQWRPHGVHPVAVTNRRLLVHANGGYASLWFTGIRDLAADIDQAVIDVTIDGDHPWRFTGPGAASLAVVLDYLTGRRQLTKVCPSLL